MLEALRAKTRQFFLEKISHGYGFRGTYEEPYTAPYNPETGQPGPSTDVKQVSVLVGSFNSNQIASYSLTDDARLLIFLRDELDSIHPGGKVYDGNKTWNIDRVINANPVTIEVAARCQCG